MIYNSLTTNTEKYSAPVADIISVSQDEILCASNKGQTEDFEFEDFEM